MQEAPNLNPFYATSFGVYSVAWDYGDTQTLSSATPAGAPWPVSSSVLRTTITALAASPGGIGHRLPRRRAPLAAADA